MPRPMRSAMGKSPGLKPMLPIQREQMNRRVVHADADAGGVHRADEARRARRLRRQHDLEHVPVAVLEILGRQLAAERAIEAARNSGAPARARRALNSSRRASWPRPMRAAMSVRLCLPPGSVTSMTAVGEALDALQPPQLAAPRLLLIVEHQAAALGGGDVLVGVKADGDQIAAGADRAARPVRAHRLRRILDAPAAVPARDRVQPVAIDRQPGQIHRQQRARARRDRRLDAAPDRCCACADRCRRTPGARRRARSRWRSRPTTAAW